MPVPVVFKKVSITRATGRPVVRRVRPIPMNSSSLQGAIITKTLLSKRTKWFGSMWLVASGVMTIHGAISAFVELRALSRDGKVPDVFEINVPENIIQLASRRKWVWLVFLGCRVKVRVQKRIEMNDYSALIVEAAPLFRGIAKAAKKSREVDQRSARNRHR